jgi:hypothetical protein
MKLNPFKTHTNYLKGSITTAQEDYIMNLLNDLGILERRDYYVSDHTEGRVDKVGNLTKQEASKFIDNLKKWKEERP